MYIVIEYPTAVVERTFTKRIYIAARISLFQIQVLNFAIVSLQKGGQRRDKNFVSSSNPRQELCTYVLRDNEQVAQGSDSPRFSRNIYGLDTGCAPYDHAIANKLPGKIVVNI